MHIRHILSFAAGLFLAAAALDAQNIVIRIDDMGSSHSANLACIDCYRNGIAKTVEVMPNAAWFPEAVKLLRENPGLDVGVHLTLTSEWDNVKWRPLTDCKSILDDYGYFMPRIRVNKKFPGKSVLECNVVLEEIEAEFRAQIEMCLKYIPQTSHISGHMGSNNFSPKVAALVRRLADEYGLPSIDNNDSEATLNFKFTGYNGPHGTYKEKLKSLSENLTHLDKGCNYLFLDHPAYDDPEMAGVYHPGYENVASDRQGVRDMLCSKKLKKILDKNGINVISVADLIKMTGKK